MDLLEDTEAVLATKYYFPLPSAFTRPSKITIGLFTYPSVVHLPVSINSIRKVKTMASDPLITIRNYHGYYQYLECREIGNKPVYTWVFYICGFSFNNKHASILRFDGSKEIVPINNKDEIFICGKHYGRENWNH